MEPTGCSRYANDVTIPKFPPPPRSPQNRSGCSVVTRGQQLAIGGDHIGGEQVVAGEAV